MIYKKMDYADNIENYNKSSNKKDSSQDSLN